MMPNWTKDQQSAIETKGGKVIVSAAAGSGKTAVLSERVLKTILSGVSVDRLLIVTFTNAAAAEMKERILDKLKDELSKNPDNSYLEKQIVLIKEANIMTMDAFYSKVVKENFHLLGIEKNFEILSNEKIKLLNDKVLKRVLEESFDNTEDYEYMLDFFGANSVSLVKNLVLKVSNVLDTVPFEEEFIKKMICMYEKDNDFYKVLFLDNFKNNMKSYLALYDEITEELYENEEDFTKLIQMVSKESKYIDRLIKSSFDDIHCNLKLIVWDRLSVPKDHKDDSVIIKYKVIRDSLKKELKNKFSEMAYITNDVYEQEKEKTLKAIKILFYVVNNFRIKLMGEKNKLSAYTFSDIAKFVIKLLFKDGKRTSLAKKISLEYDEILIDEYQDTNNMQNVIFNAISNNNSNLFMVGDVKQSIYRFRSAAPELFNSEKNTASKLDFPRLITLSKNFRSRKQVLDFCNFIFENTMSDYFGEVDYNEDEMLYLGASYPDKDDVSSEITIIDKNSDEEKDDDDLSKTQKEAIVVAGKVKELLDSNYKVYDNKKGLYRSVRPNDIVILLRSMVNASVFKEALNKKKISAYLESSLEYFDNYEVKLIINLLKVIDNPYDDVALLSTLTSSYINIDYDLISLARVNYPYKSLYESVKKYDSPTLNDVLNKIDNLRTKSLNLKVSSLISSVYKKFNIIPILSSMIDGNKRKKNLEHMIKHAVDLEKNENISLHDFITYIEKIILNKSSLSGINPLSEGENVLITTIHKSKGLEYPVVILSETGKSFNFEDLRKDIMINDELGFACNIRDNEYKLKYETVPMMVFKENEKKKMLSEELRVLYVALTRAKEKIIITGFSNNVSKLVTKASSKMSNDKTISSFYLNGITNYLDILVACLLRHKSGSCLRNLSSVENMILDDPSDIRIKIIPASNIDESLLLEKQKIEKESFDIDYYKQICKESITSKIPRYLSVSDIKHKKDYLRNPNFLDDGIRHTDVGTLYHKIFEYLPIKKYDLKNLKETLDEMVSLSLISKEDLSLINLENIFSYLTSDLYDQLVLSDKVYKEFKIDFEIPANYYDKTLKSGKILTSGVIDLLFFKDDTYTIIDYKTDNVDGFDELIERYKIQLDLYEMAVKQRFNAKNVNKYIYSTKLNNYTRV